MTPITLNPEQIFCYGGFSVLGIGVCNPGCWIDILWAEPQR